jgi:Fe-S-cluster-containing hydrogenase component 2
MKILTFDPQRCDGARGCEVTCAQTWFKTDDTDKSSLRIFERDGRFSAEFCIQCGQCIEVCPVNALTQDKQGIVRVIQHRCVGCMSCVGFCPYNVMYVDVDADADRALPFKCVACGQCVKVCPTDALKIVERDTASTEVWQGHAE